MATTATAPGARRSIHSQVVIGWPVAAAVPTAAQSPPSSLVTRGMEPPAARTYRPGRHGGAPGAPEHGKELRPGGARRDGGSPGVSAADGPVPQPREHLLLGRQVGVPYIVVFLNKADMVDDEELLELVEVEVRELGAVASETGIHPRPHRERLESQSGILGREGEGQVGRFWEIFASQPRKPGELIRERGRTGFVSVGDDRGGRREHIAGVARIAAVRVRLA